MFRPLARFHPLSLCPLFLFFFTAREPARARGHIFIRAARRADFSTPGDEYARNLIVRENPNFRTNNILQHTAGEANARRERGERRSVTLRKE